MSSKLNKIIILIILIILILLSFAIITVRFLNTNHNKIAKIYQNGSLIKEIDLDKLNEPLEFSITDDNGHTNTIRAEKGKICMISANCPDKICVNQGWIENGIAPIVCLPNKITIEITGTNDSADELT